jgi:5'-3' exonuclease
VGCEADDMLGVRQCELSCDSDESIICTIDKDLNMIPGSHYNFVKKERYVVTPEDGIRFFYYQMLIGDTTDNIKGVVGIGKQKATKLLDRCSTEGEYFDAVRDAYSNDEEMLMNARCLYIWKYMHDDPLEHFKRFDCMFGENNNTTE